ncbi:hypothetical protein BC829DRAFT_100144 [Chytridium lagenaria]|nr:hypothetical protein BC829DRAFT_100144 [Chytridium lagenaria]
MSGFVRLLFTFDFRNVLVDILVLHIPLYLFPLFVLSEEFLLLFSFCLFVFLSFLSLISTHSAPLFPSCVCGSNLINMPCLGKRIGEFSEVFKYTKAFSHLSIDMAHHVVPTIIYTIS